MLLWGEVSQRSEFGIVAKRIEWLSAAKTASAKTMLDKYVKDGKVPSKMPRSKCRECGKPLIWGDGTYNFDHYDNNSANNSQRNCYLVCRNCHGKATKVRLVRELDPWFRTVIGYIPQKLKAGYKKNPRKLESKTSDKTATRTPRKSATKATEKTGIKSAKKPVNKTVKKPPGRTAGKPLSKRVRKPARKTTEKPSKKTARKGG